MGQLENEYQGRLIKKIKRLLPGCAVLKQDTAYQQGIPDLLILWGDCWAMLEVKRKRPTRESDWEPNQEWYLAEFGRMSFTACIYPANEREVLDDLQYALGARRQARSLQRQ